MLDQYDSYVLYYRYAVQPASGAYAYAPTLTPVWGDGDLAGWAIYDGMIDLKHCDGGVWLRLDGSAPGESYALRKGFVYCGPEEAWKTIDYTPVSIPGDWRERELGGRFGEIFGRIYALDWMELKNALGADGAACAMAAVRANAFNSLANRSAWEGADIYGDIRHMPQAVRTISVMYGAANLCPEVEADYACLLKELCALDPEEFTDCLSQIPAERAEQIEALLG